MICGIIEIYIVFRTKQEEMRSKPQQEALPFSLSTEECIYIQAGLVAALLIFGLTR